MDRIERLARLLSGGKERAQFLIDALDAHTIEGSQERLVDDWIVDLELARRDPPLSKEEEWLRRQLSEAEKQIEDLEMVLDDERSKYDLTIDQFREVIDRA